MLEMLMDPAVLAGLATLIVLEVVLGIDNLVFIAILADKLPPHQRDKARLIGLSLALIMRLALLASIAWIIGLTAPVFVLGDHPVSWRDVILIGGGLFLLAKATKEIHERLEGHASHGSSTTGQVYASFGVVIAQILALDAVFSLDSIITAVGMVDELWVMMTAVIVAMVIMIAASKPLTTFVGKHPTVIILCLSFLLLIGLSLILEGVHVEMPKSYLYAAIGFSILIEAFNQISSRNRLKALERQPLRQRAADGIFRLLTPASPVPVLAGGALPTDAVVAPVADGFQPSEQQMIRGVIELADQPVRAIMTPRAEIVWLDTEDPREVNRDRLIDSGRTRVLVCRGALDEVVGIVEARAVLPELIRADSLDLAAAAQRPLAVPDSITALRLIDVMRETGERFAIVTDPDGNIDGVVTATDIFAAIAGDLAEDEDDAEIQPIDENTIEASGSATLVDIVEALGRETIASNGRYSTLAGFLLFEFGRVPLEGERIARGGLEFEVLATSPSRIERVLVRAEAPVAAS